MSEIRESAQYVDQEDEKDISPIIDWIDKLPVGDSTIELEDSGKEIPFTLHLERSLSQNGQATPYLGVTFEGPEGTRFPSAYQEIIQEEGNPIILDLEALKQDKSYQERHRWILNILLSISRSINLQADNSMANKGEVFAPIEAASVGGGDGSNGDGKPKRKKKTRKSDLREVPPIETDTPNPEKEVRDLIDAVAKEVAALELKTPRREVVDRVKEHFMELVERLADRHFLAVWQEVPGDRSQDIRHPVENGQDRFYRWLRDQGIVRESQKELRSAVLIVPDIGGERIFLNPLVAKEKLHAYQGEQVAPFPEETVEDFFGNLEHVNKSLEKLYRGLRAHEGLEGSLSEQEIYDASLRSSQEIEAFMAVAKKKFEEGTLMLSDVNSARSELVKYVESALDNGVLYQYSNLLGAGANSTEIREMREEASELITQKGLSQDEAAKLTMIARRFPGKYRRTHIFLPGYLFDERVFKEETEAAVNAFIAEVKLADNEIEDLRRRLRIGSDTTPTITTGKPEPIAEPSEAMSLEMKESPIGEKGSPVGEEELYEEDEPVNWKEREARVGEAKGRERAARIANLERRYQEQLHGIQDEINVYKQEIARLKEEQAKPTDQRLQEAQEQIERLQKNSATTISYLNEALQKRKTEQQRLENDNQRLAAEHEHALQDKARVEGERDAARVRIQELESGGGTTIDPQLAQENKELKDQIEQMNLKLNETVDDEVKKRVADYMSQVQTRFTTLETQYRQKEQDLKFAQDEIARLQLSGAGRISPEREEELRKEGEERVKTPLEQEIARLTQELAGKETVITQLMRERDKLQADIQSYQEIKESQELEQLFLGSTVPSEELRRIYQRELQKARDAGKPLEEATQYATIVVQELKKLARNRK